MTASIERNIEGFVGDYGFERTHDSLQALREAVRCNMRLGLAEDYVDGYREMLGDAWSQQRYMRPIPLHRFMKTPLEEEQERAHLEMMDPFTATPESNSEESSSAAQGNKVKVTYVVLR